jgi:hypothetical protein
MTAKRYRTIVADPPWQYDGGVSFGGSPGKLHGTELPYPSMPLSEIAASARRSVSDSPARRLCTRQAVRRVSGADSAVATSDRSPHGKDLA